MATDILVPTLGESVSEATIGRWFKKPGDPVAADEPLVELETDKVTLEVNAPAAGQLGEILVKDGETVEPGALLGSIVEAGGAGGTKTAPKKEAEAKAESRAEAPKASAPDAKAVEEAPARDSAAGYGNHGDAAPAAAAPVRRQRSGGGQARARIRRRSGGPERLRQGRPRDQGRHAGRDREGPVADPHPRLPRRPGRRRRVRPPSPTTPPARSGCA